MITLELDWAADEAPEVGTLCDDSEVTVIVAYDATAGPAGWPTVTVYAHATNGTPAYREAMALDAWLRDEYGVEDDDERQGLLDMAR